MNHYPAIPTTVNHVEPAPRRVRAFLAGRPVLDTTSARYVWEWPPYPQYYIPRSDVLPDVLVDEGTTVETERGIARVHGLKLGNTHRPRAALVFDTSPVKGVEDTVRFEWSALDAWFEEDERVFVHPRDPYSRVDAIRSTRTVTIELAGVALASSHSPVMVFETGLPTRYYLNRTDVRFEHLEATATETACPYKGTTSGYWSATIEGTRYKDIAWAYDFPTRQLLPIAGLIAFFNEKVDIAIDGERLTRPVTHFS
ncbi:MAG: DUF427 domain-containing protein [Actinomycetota bacterium]|nr:DUF427 domain-containing protein [Actinomycetota bacterium]